MMAIKQDRLADLLHRAMTECQLLSKEADDLKQDQLRHLLDMVVLACDDQLDQLGRNRR